MPRQRIARFKNEEQLPVTMRAVELFKRALLLEKTKDKVERDYSEWTIISVELHREFARKPWDTNIFDVQIDDDPPKEFRRDEMKLQSWLRAKQLRMQLIGLT
jgi:hypothetical protein